MSGIFVSRGMTVGVPAGGVKVSIGSNGAPNFSLSLHVHFDVCPTWLVLAVRHLDEAKEKRLARIAAWKSNDEDTKAKTLEREYECSMQAIMAAAIAIDALYAVVKGKVEITDALVENWCKNKTPKYAQIGEVLHRAFALKRKVATGLREDLTQIFRFRDLAVHPSGDIEATILHSDILGRLTRRYPRALMTTKSNLSSAALPA